MQIENNTPDTVKPSEVSRRRRQSRTGKQAKIIANYACPSCRDKGGDSTGNHLMVFESGKGYCNRCPKHFSEEEVKAAKEEKYGNRRRFQKSKFQEAYKYNKGLTLEDMPHLGFLGDKHRGITAETDRHFGIRTQVDERNGKPLARFYPYHVEEELFGYKNRKLPKEWESDIGTIKGTDLFGWNLCKGPRKVLAIVEGEEDCAAGWQMWKAINMRSDNRRIKRSNPHIVSLPNGAKGAEKILLHHFDELMKYEKIIWFGDNYKLDVEGAIALERAVQVIGVDKLYVSEYPDRKKDLCDILKLGGQEALDAFAEMYFNAKKYQPADIIDGADLTLEDIEREQISGVPLPFPSVQEKIDGLRPYEHTLLFAGSGIGKSTFAKAIGHWVCTEYDWKVGNIFLEERDDKTQQGYIAYDNKVSLREYRKDYNIIPREDKQKTLETVIKNMMFLRHMGSIDPDVLMNKIRYLHAKGCKLIILDHISMVVTQSDDERKDIDNLMEQIYRFCETHPVHVISIVHLNRSGKANFERGAEITSGNLRGSAGLLQMAWNAIGIEGDNQHDQYPDARFPRFLKCRETGEVGLCSGALMYNKKTGRFKHDESVTKDDIMPSFEKQTPSMGGGSKGGGGGFDNKAS